MSIDFRALLRAEKEKFRKTNQTSSFQTPENSLKPQSIDDQSISPIPDIQDPSYFPLLSFLPFSPFETFQIGDISNIYSIPDVIDESTEESIINCCSTSSQPWTILRSRKVKCWGDMSSMREIPTKSLGLPDWLNQIVSGLVSNQIFQEELKPNHVLLNSYRSTDGILHHVDGPIYHPRVAILSLGSPCLMTFRPNLASNEIGEKFGGDIFSVLLRPRSLLVFSEDVYERFMHGISSDSPVERAGETCPCLNLKEGERDGEALIHRGDRISLTLRRTKEVASTS